MQYCIFHTVRIHAFNARRNSGLPERKTTRTARAQARYRPVFVAFLCPVHWTTMTVMTASYSLTHHIEGEDMLRKTPPSHVTVNRL